MKEETKSIKIIQLTDCHLLKDEGLTLNINTNLAYKKIIEKMQPDLLDADAVFMTGDLSQDQSSESYKIIVNSFKNFNKKIYWIPGNHDAINTMQSVFETGKNFIRTKKLSRSSWDFIFLDTKHEEEDYGLMADSELALLSSELKESKAKSIALVMHHHPIPVQTPLIDKYILKNRDVFFEIIKQYPVRLIMCGHVHNDYSLTYENMKLETAPASCFQFKKGIEELNVEKKIGYKIYYFSSNAYESETKIWEN